MAARRSPVTAVRLADTVIDASVSWVLTPPSTTSLLLLFPTLALPPPLLTETPVPVHAPPLSAVPQVLATVRLKLSRALRVSVDTKRLAVVVPVAPRASWALRVTRYVPEAP